MKRLVGPRIHRVGIWLTDKVNLAEVMSKKYHIRSKWDLEANANNFGCALGPFGSFEPVTTDWDPSILMCFDWLVQTFQCWDDALALQLAAL